MELFKRRITTTTKKKSALDIIIFYRCEKFLLSFTMHTLNCTIYFSLIYEAKWRRSSISRRIFYLLKCPMSYSIAVVILRLKNIQTYSFINGLVGIYILVFLLFEMLHSYLRTDYINLFRFWIKTRTILLNLCLYCCHLLSLLFRTGI